MKKLILVAGPPACGKTYVAKIISEKLNSVVYLDKDDLYPLVHRIFDLSNKEFDMDGEFYTSNVRDVEYETLINTALSTLRYNNTVIVNAPLSKELRNVDYVKNLKEKVNNLGAKLIVVWVTAPLEVVKKRMQTRNAPRDALKLKDFKGYAKNINYNAPTNLLEESAVDSLIVFDNGNELSLQNSLSNALKILN